MARLNRALICDLCGERAPVLVEGIYDPAAAAKRIGWLRLLFNNPKTVCGNCVTKIVREMEARSWRRR